MSLREIPIVHKSLVLLFVATPLVAVCLAVYLSWNSYVFASDIALFFALYIITAVGIGTGYHRMLTHQSFQAPEWLRCIILICGCMAFEGAPDVWAATHIKHHAHSDEEGDPHSPLEGFWHAHLGWLFDLKNFPIVSTYAPQLLQDRTVRFVSQYYLVWMGLSLALPLLIGGWTGLLWGGFVRIFVVTHVTWSVNSICHTFGNRAFETTDESRNEWVIGLLGLGEGWHNNHHAFPRNAFHGMRWWQLDVNGLIIRGLEKLGLATQIQRVTHEAEIAQQTRAQAMKDAMIQMRQSVLSSLSDMRAELCKFGARFFPEQLLSDAQWSQCEKFHTTAVQRLDAMRDSIVRSQHLKRQKILQYQKEAQALVDECKRRWDVVAGKAALI